MLTFDNVLLRVQGDHSEVGWVEAGEAVDDVRAGEGICSKPGHPRYMMLAALVQRISSRFHKLAKGSFFFKGLVMLGRGV